MTVYGGVWRWEPTQEDGNGDESGDGNESSNGDGNGDEDGNGDGNENGNGDGNEDGIGESGRAAVKRKKQRKSCRRHGGNGHFSDIILLALCDQHWGTQQ